MVSGKSAGMFSMRQDCNAIIKQWKDELPMQKDVTGKEDERKRSVKEWWGIADQNLSCLGFSQEYDGFPAIRSVRYCARSKPEGLPK